LIREDTGNFLLRTDHRGSAQTGPTGLSAVGGRNKQHMERNMNDLLRSLTALGGLLLVTAAKAHGPAAPRYRINELPVPDALRTGCVEGYVASGAIQRINDFGVVNANFRCYTQADPATATFQARDAAFVAASWFGAVELARPSVAGFAFGSAINNRGEIFGFETVEGGFSGVRWTLGGGHERLFFDPACGSLQVGGASDGNGRYVVGWGWRGDSRLPPPVDTLCLRTTWLIRGPNGVETPGPLDGQPAAINAFHVAVGTSDGSAIRYHVPTGELRVLHAVDATHSAEANDINDLGEVAGRIALNTSAPGPGAPCGGPGVAVRWERDGRERVLPHLPGAVASHAFGVGYDGETVGTSGPGTSCSDALPNRAVLWLAGRAFDLNTLIPRSGITLTHALSINRRGQISAGGFDNGEPLTQCPSVQLDPVTGTVTYTVAACRNTRMYVLTPVGR
jgi:uncharacterized membrane protein